MPIAQHHVHQAPMFAAQNQAQVPNDFASLYGNAEMGRTVCVIKIDVLIVEGLWCRWIHGLFSSSLGTDARTARPGISANERGESRKHVCGVFPVLYESISRSFAVRLDSYATPAIWLRATV